MLTIRMQRTGRSGHAQYRVIVQDSRFTPTSGRVVAYLGSYDPHTKQATIDGEKASSYLSNGAQPSERVVKLLKAQGIKVPEWVKQPATKERSIRNVEKLRRNRPAEPVVEQPEPEETPAEETPTPAAEDVVVEDANDTPEAEPVAEAPEAASEEAAELSEPAEAPAEPEAEAPAAASPEDK